MTRMGQDFSYTFSPRETVFLAYFLRRHEDALPDGLSDFAHSAEKAMYDAMCVGEAEKFYS